jgi:hypothetical protein
MILETTQDAYQDLLISDKINIEEIKILIAQNKAIGNPVDKLYKQLVTAHEKQTKHLIEYDKWCRENQIEPFLPDEQTTQQDADTIESTAENTEPASQFNPPNDLPVNDEFIPLLSASAFDSFENMVRKNCRIVSNQEILNLFSYPNKNLTDNNSPPKNALKISPL